jgi:hypothetical protein
MPDRIKKFVPASAAVLQAIYEASINTRRDESGAAPTTLEAAMYSLRERGERALAEPNCQRRLSEMSPAQIDEIITRLTKMRRNYPGISDALIARLNNEYKAKRNRRR